MNNFHAVGRIAAEIKLQKNEKGVVYTRFPLAISRGKNKDGENRGTDFPMIYDDCSFSGYEYEDEGDIL